MLQNREVFRRDPSGWTIPNDGIAKVGEPESAPERDILRYELQRFVCEGEYARGLERILDNYLAHLGDPTQKAVWVSGFFGSGKSHLVRVLEYLWGDYRFPEDGATARGLASLTPEIQAHLRELTTAGQQRGGLWSAAGMLSAGTASIRLALLGILFASAGLPAQYPAAKFVIWLKQNGFYSVVKRQVEQAEVSFDHELRNMYVSTHIARAVASVIPEIAPDPMAASDRIFEQFRDVDEISDAELIATMRDVLALQSTTPGKLPCTLIVLDETQQGINDDPSRALQVQTIVESCVSEFGGALLFVATGQGSLEATPVLEKLRDRFSVSVMLSDRDVEQVVREVVLRKAPEREADLRAMLDTVSGEIDRHLQGTRIAPVSEDRKDLLPDYPLLPVRRRFWERVLRAVDPAGTAGQLRTQLRIVHEATSEVADDPLGTVIAGDRIYAQLKPGMLQKGVLLRELSNTIDEQDDGTPDGRLRTRLCGTIFLITKLDPDPTGPMATGLRATPEVLADLLVADLPAGSAPLRQQIPLVLADLVERGTLQLVEGEYRLQTRVSAEWDRRFRELRQEISADPGRIADDRTKMLRDGFAVDLKNVTLMHGTSRVARKLDLHFGQDAPRTDTGNAPVWVRDAWSVTERAVEDEARTAGTDSPIVFVFLPRREGDALRDAVAALGAATQTLAERGIPSTQEGIEARAAMQSRQEGARANADRLVRAILDGAKVYQGGGNEVVEGTLAASVRVASERALDRMFPEFADEDPALWKRVFERATDGASDALSVTKYHGEPSKHPICAQVLSYVGRAGKRGIDIRRHFTSGRYGWSQDVVDGALLALLAASELEGFQGGSQVTANGLNRTGVGTTEFRSSSVVVGVVHRIGVKGLLAGRFPARTDAEVVEAVPAFLDQLSELAGAAGGPAPLPERPDTDYVKNLRALSGNERFMSIYEAREQLAADWTAWSDTRDKVAERQPRWDLLLALLRHANGMPVAGTVTREIDAIKQNRSLLADPDPVKPLLDEVSDALRSRLRDARDRLETARKAGVAELAATEDWQALTDTQHATILSANRLDPVAEPAVGTDDELLASLTEGPLGNWEAEALAVPARLSRALVDAAKLNKRDDEPQIVEIALQHATLRSADDVDRYLAGVRQMILQHIEAGKTVVV